MSVSVYKKPRARGKAKRTAKKKINQRYIQKQSQVRQRGIIRKKLIVERAISRRGRETAQAAPKATQPQTPQNFFLDSTVIKNFEYRIASQVLKIWFVREGAWEYYGVPESTVYGLANAPSKGHYFYYHIRTSFRYRRVE